MKVLPQTRLMATTIFFAIIATLFVAINSSQAFTQPYISGHQINFATGNKYHSVTDVRLSGPGRSLSFSRTYNSQSDITSALGYGWTTTFTERLMIEASTITLVQEGGRHVAFKDDGRGNWINEIGRKRLITANAGGYQLKEASGTIKQYSSSGNLLNVTDRNGSSRVFTYAADLLVSISDNFGRSLSFTYTNGKLTQVSSVLGVWSYSYQNDNLTEVINPDGTYIQYIYDDTNDAHNLTGIIDETGSRILTVTYDNEDRVTSSAKANGTNQVAIAYLGSTQREVTNSLGVKTSYKLKIIHGVAQVASMTGPGCSTCGGTANTTYLYDARLQALEATDGKGIKTSYTYDSAGNKTSITRAAGTPLASTTSRTYDPDTNQLTAVTNNSVANPEQENRTEMAYDTNGNLLTRTESGFSGTTGLKRTTAFTYDNLGRLTGVDGPRQDVADTFNLIYYADDPAEGPNRGFLHTVTNGMDQAISYEHYNGFGKAARIIDANGVVSEFTYNTRGKVISKTTVGRTTTYQYDLTGKLTQVTMPGGRTFMYTYTPAGQVAEIHDPEGNFLKNSYDSEGRRTSLEIYDSGGIMTTFANFVYDDAGRLKETINPDGSSEQLSFDEVGNLVSRINTLAESTSYNYDVLNRLTAITEPGNIVTDFDYDGHDNQKSVTDARTNTTGFQYDDFGRKVSRISPDTGSTSYSYDPADNLISQINATARSVKYHYDTLNRPVSVDLDGTSGAINMTYDKGENGAGRLTKITDQAGTTVYSYNNHGQVTSESRTIGATAFVTQYDYNGTNGDLKSVIYPSGMAVAFQHDADGRIAGLSANAIPLMQNVVYLPFGPLKSYQFGTDQSAAFTYDQRYQLTRIKAQDMDYQYNRDALGRVTAIIGPQPPSPPEAANSYSYETGSNRLAEKTGSAPAVYTIDASGNIVNDGTLTFFYDALNRLERVEQNGAELARYSYDAMHRRISKTVAGITTCYIYGLSGHLLAEAKADGTPLRDYIFIQGVPFAVKTYEQTEAGLYYYLNDHQGTPQRLIDSAGQVVWQAAYLPFGKAEVLTATVTNNLRFPGQYFDSETGLHYNWHRFYDPETGRYISADPIGLAGGMNLYAYVENDPVNKIDPWGLDTAGCDSVPDSWETACRLECCARHDECYDENDCSCSSWSGKEGECSQCNYDVTDCFLECGGSDEDDPNRPNYYCASQHRYIRIPGDFPDYDIARAACQNQQLGIRPST